MKKIVCISGALLLAASACVFVCANKQNNEVDLFRANVEALTRTESGYMGFCSNSTGDCLFECPNCGVQSYGPGFAGPSYGMYGTCAKCGHTIQR